MSTFIPQSSSQSIIVLLIIWLVGCGQSSDALYQEQSYVFGTLVTISVWGVPAESARQAVSRIISDLQTMHTNWHAWHPSPVSELNQAFAQGHSKIITDPNLLHLLIASQTLAQKSEGLFNPAIGKLIELWGFHQDELPTGPPPHTETIAALVALQPRMNDIEIQGNQVSSRNPAVQLDFGAIAKGYAVDLAIERLQAMGIHHAIVNAGGNLKVIGQHGARPWRIGIRHPDGKDVLAAVTISGEESVMTSGNYERYREHAGKRYSHILDPRSGMPAQHFTSVTVLHPNGLLADAASTALTVAGLDEWQKIAQQMDIHYAMLVDTNGTVYMTPQMAARIEFVTPEKPKIVLSPPL